MNATKCPDQSVLEQLLQGRINSSDAAEVERHLLQCESCAKIADQLVTSSEITAMVAQVDTGAFRNPEAEFVDRLIHEAQDLKRLQRLPDDPSAMSEQTLVGDGHSEMNGETMVPKRTFATSDKSYSSFLNAAQSPDEIGRLGGYRILQVLGSGGMGVVYRAEDPSLKRLVALKAMKPSVAANPDAKARFMKEAEATAAIEHDNIVTIYQVGEDNGIPFIAMQFLKGESLQARLDRTPQLPEKDVLRIGREIATGLQAAHSRGLIHRDIKPDNIWLQEENDRVRIVDFGLVRNSAEDVGMTQSGVVLGTPKYMAPEQARGENVDHRCDLFSLGSVLYRMVAGKAPFEGSNLTATLIAVAHEDARPLSEVAPDVNPQLADLITELLSKNRDQRPASAADVAARLQRIVSSPAAAAAKAGSDSNKHQPPRRGIGAAFFGGFAALALLAVLVIKLRGTDGTVVVELDSAVPVSQVEIDGNQVKFQPDASGRTLTLTVPKGTHQLELKTSDGLSLTTDLGSNPVQVAVNETTKIRAWLEPKLAADKPENAAAAATDLNSTPSTSPTMTSSVTGQSGSHGEAVSTHVADSRDGRRTENLWPPGPLPVWARDTWNAAALKQPEHGMTGVVERPSSFEGMGRWNVDTAQSRGIVNVARFSPDGQWLATGSTDGHTRIYDAATMKLHQLMPGLGGQHGTHDLSWHPDSRRIAVVADSLKALRIWAVDGKLLREEFVEGDTYSTFMAVAWTFDGQRLICGGANRLEVRDADGNLLKALVSGQEGPHCDIGNIAVSPKNQRFACWQNDAVRIWNSETFELEHEIDVPYQGRSHGGHRIKWSQQDRIALSTNEQLLICSADGKILREFPNEPLCAFTWRPDGENLTIWRWDPYNLNSESGEVDSSQVVVGSSSSAVPTAMDWSPDGKRLVAASGRLVICNEGLNELEFDSGSRMFQVTGLDLNPDGSQISTVSAFGDDCVRIWSANGVAQQVMPLTEMVFPGAKVAWSPDGSRVATVSLQASHLRIGSPENGFTNVEGHAMSLAWSPDGAQLAAGLSNGHVLITDRDGKTLNSINTGESGWLNVAWSKHGQLVAHVGRKILRINPDPAEAQVSLLAEVNIDSADLAPQWSPNGHEVYLHRLQVNISDNVPEPVREILYFPAAWSPDGSRFLGLGSIFTSLVRPDGLTFRSRGEIGSTSASAGAWSPSGETIFVGYDQSLLMARNAEDLHVKWTTVMLPKQKSVTFDVGGAVLDGDRETLETEFVYYTADDAGNITMFTPTEFELRTGQEILPVPGRSFDGEHGLVISVGDEWMAAPEEFSTTQSLPCLHKVGRQQSQTPPAIPVVTFSRPGDVMFDVFVQKTGAMIDPSWILAESAKAQEEKLSATVVGKEVRKIAGRDAMWMIVEGPGTGSAITGNGPVKTTQHWIAIPRETDVLVALLTSPSGTFKTSEELFLKAIETLRLKD